MGANKKTFGTSAKRIQKILKYAERKWDLMRIAKKVNVCYSYVYSVIHCMRNCRKCQERCWGEYCQNCKGKNNYGISFNRNSSEYLLRMGKIKSSSYGNQQEI